MTLEDDGVLPADTLTIDADRTWQLSGATVQGIVIDADPGALLQVSSADASLDGVTLSTDTRLNNGAIVTVSGGLTLDNSTLRLNHSSNGGGGSLYVQLNFAGGVQTLGGTGTVE